jgi:HSP20 family molecular chaperone IbpA
LPTNQKKDTAIFICQLLSNLYQPINLFRYDKRVKIIYILAGINDDIEITINEEGKWSFE